MSIDFEQIKKTFPDLVDIVPLTRQEMADAHVMRHLNDANRETHGLDWLCAWHERRQRQARIVVSMGQR